MYSGYLDGGDNKSLHYWFFESRSNTSTTDPVVLWLNGGPGCSSLLGAVGEVGPLLFKENSTEWADTVNNYTWNNRSNLLFLEMPAGVGFSLDTNETHFTDEMTA